MFCLMTNSLFLSQTLGIQIRRCLFLSDACTYIILFVFPDEAKGMSFHKHKILLGKWTLSDQ